MHDDTVRADDAVAGACGAFPQAACGTVALENPPAAAAARPQGEAIQQAAQLASWEDEGGTTSS